MIDLIPNFLLCILLTVLAMEALLLYRYTEHNILQKTLLAIIAVWFVMTITLGTGLINIFYDSNTAQTPGVLNFYHILICQAGIFSLLFYPALVIQPRIMSLRDSLLYLSPLLSTIAIYLIWHMVTGHHVDYRYLTIEDMYQNLWTIPVILRLLMMLFFTMYVTMILFNIWQLAPIYNKYSEDTYSDTAYNVKWVRVVVAAIGSIVIIYIIVIFSMNIVIDILFTLVSVTLFIIMTDNAVFHKVPISENIKVKWSFKGGWERMEKPDPEIENSYVTICTKLDEWMKEKKPFSDPEFSSKDIFKVFPELNYNTMTKMLSERNHTFQSYVRLHRIDEACRLIHSNPGAKGCDISFNVGFSSPPSFTRAFVAVMGITPVQFKENKVKLQN